MLADTQKLYLSHTLCLKKQKISEQTPLFSTYFVYAKTIVEELY